MGLQGKSSSRRSWRCSFRSKYMQSIAQIRQLTASSYAPVLLAHLLLEVAAPSAQIPIPSLKTFCSSRVVVEFEYDDNISKIQLGETVYLLSRQREQAPSTGPCSRVTCIGSVSATYLGARLFSPPKATTPFTHHGYLATRIKTHPQ
jgi:hypothetical protein